MDYNQCQVQLRKPLNTPKYAKEPRMATEDQAKQKPVSWRKCYFCRENLHFKSPREFCRHLRDFHCTKEGGSFVCRYGANGVCPSLPLEGVSDRDYEDHVTKMHAVGETARVGNGEPRPESPAPSTSVSQPSVVEDQHKWTVFMSKVNLPAALNNPRAGCREMDIFSRTWGEGFERAEVKPSPHLPEITKDHFRRYIKKVGARLKVHQLASAQPPPREEAPNTIPVDAFPLLHARQQAEKARAELEVIPKLFMLPNFSLENPDTFNAVFPWTQIESARQDQSGSGRQSVKLLQEKMSHYLDLVEVQIARQISLRSEAFFLAMTSHDKLQENMANTCAAIKHLRERMKNLSEQTVEGPLKVFHLSKARANHVKLYHKLKLMATVHQTQPTIQLLLATNEFVGALDLISTTQEVLAQELAGIHSFRHLGSQLAEMEKLIDRMMQEDFVRYASTDLNRPLTDDCSVIEEEKLVAIVLGMMRQQRFNFIDVYREEACTALKTTLKQTVIEAVAAADDIDTEGPVGSLADQMRLLNYQQWMELLRAVFRNQLVMLRRIQGVINVMQEVVAVAAGINHADTPKESNVFFDKEEELSDLPMQNGDVGSADEESPKPPTTPHTPLRVSVNNDVDIMISHEDYDKVSKQLRETLCKICDHAHDRCVKLMVARAKDGFLERLGSAEFVLLSRATEQFVSDCEAICGRKSTSLRGCLQSQANRFISRFHEERKTKLSLILDNERWKQADVPAEFQDLVDHIMAHNVLSLPDKKTDADKKPQEYLQVNGQRYAVVGTVLMLLKMVCEYCQCADDIPSVTSDILNRLVELLKMFNSRTCQLILGAGALQLVGLRTITTKNLALSSRCLQLALYFLPRVRSHFETRLLNKQATMLKHFEHVVKDYSDHISEIANKLVAIMEGMLDMQLDKWEVRPPMPSSCMRNICKQMCKLHEAIVELLPPEQVLELFQRIHGSFKLRLRCQLIRLGVTNDGGPQHGLVMADIAYYLGYIKSLPGLELMDDNMDDIWDKR